MSVTIQLKPKVLPSAFIMEQIESTIHTFSRMIANPKLIDQIDEAAALIVDAYRRGNKLLIAGNGGSAADAQHIAGELVSRFFFERDALPAVALTTDTSILTAIGNDYGYENLFSRQIQGNGAPGDVFLGISTSGNSPNILKAFLACQEKGITSIGLTGHTGGRMQEYCTHCIKVPAQLTPRIQEAHLLIGHIICSIVERSLFGSES